ncbi:DUF7167 family protein [Sporosarcina limicola]|uniref:Uncharacterized protein n=1 Tax=Sporosarcina limicola TaxID=34101 RepID=A0A927MGF2_9BACL|nr:hypothetical protein [Sporosarcina limicola]MBE1554153.1 hypothetical protein [Sporosarcina limicola]
MKYGAILRACRERAGFSKGVKNLKKHLIHVSVGFVAGVKFAEVIELPAEFSEEDVEEEFKEWVWNQLDAYRTEL